MSHAVEELDFMITKSAFKRAGRYLPWCVAGILVVLVLVLACVNIQVQLAREFEQEALGMEATARYLRMLPLRDMSGEEKKLSLLLAELENRFESSWPFGRGAGHAALGRAFLVVEDYARAKDHLEAAWKKGVRNPQLAQALGIALTELYQNQARALEVGSRDERSAFLSKAEAGFLQPALAYLSNFPSQGSQYARALIAFCRGDYQEALPHLALAYERQPWQYVAFKLEGDSLLAQGLHLYHSGNNDGALTRFRLAELSYEQAGAIAPGVARHHLDRAHVNFLMMQTEYYGSGRDVSLYYRKGAMAIETAVRVKPQSAEAFRMESMLHQQMAKSEWQNGRDPLPFLDLAIKSSEKAVALDQQEPLNLIQLASVNADVANRQSQSGLDARSAYKKVIAACEQALEKKSDYRGFNSLGLALHDLGKQEARHGGDPAPIWKRAVVAFNAAIECDDANEISSAWINLGQLYSQQARHVMDNGQDPVPFLEKGIEALSRAENMNSNRYTASYHLGRTWFFKAYYERLKGLDDTASLEKAVKNFRQASSINDHRSTPYLGEGAAGFLLGTGVWERGGNPDEYFEKALAAYGRALAIKPDSKAAMSNLADIHLQRGFYALQGQQDPRPFLSKANALFDQALAIDPHYEESLLEKSYSFFLEAQYLMKMGHGAESQIHEALALAERVLTRNKVHFQALLSKGRALTLKAQIQTDRRTADAVFLEALNALEKARDLNSVESDIHLAIADYCEVKTQWLETRRTTAEQDIELALRVLEEALAINPDHAQALAARGMFRILKSKYRKTGAEQGREDLQRAISINENLRPRYKSFL